MTKMSASGLRADIYRVLDRVLETDEPVEVERDGGVVVIAPKSPGSRLDRLTPHSEFMAGDPEEFVSVDWSGEWRP